MAFARHEALTHACMTPAMRRKFLPALRRLLGWSLGLAGLGALVGLGAIGVVILRVAHEAPDVADVHALHGARPSVLLSADGRVLMSFRRIQRVPVPLERISPFVVKALIATEDQHFYEHHGIDLPRTLAAAWHTTQGDLQGGSTITQQLARNLFPQRIGRDRTLTRKLKELLTALRIERAWSKKQILEAYLNRAPFLYHVEGIEMAARTYFGRSAAQLDLLQSATLVGMLKGTAYYNPVLHPRRALARRNLVLARMVDQGWLTAERCAALSGAPLSVNLRLEPEIRDLAPHFAVRTRAWLFDWARRHDLDLYRDGLVVHSTIDARLQHLAERSVAQQVRALQAVADVEWATKRLKILSATSTAPYLAAQARVHAFEYFWATHPWLAATSAERSAKQRLEAGFVAIDPRTGEVKAWIGSRDYAIDQYDHVAQAQRQPGSTFKPFVYGAALQAGFSPYRSYLDWPVDIALPDGRVWQPTDMSEPSGEVMTMRDGLVHSMNTITAQVGQDVGVQRIASLARALGVDHSPLDTVPSLALGTSPVTLLEMVNAYASIARGGVARAPLTVTRIEDHDGRVLARFEAAPQRVMSRDAADDLVDIMRGVIDEGTGMRLRTQFGIRADVAGKTGTSQDNADGWFILMHPSLVVGAWVGFNDQRVTMRSDQWGQGGHDAILLVGDFFRRALDDGWVDARAQFPPAHTPAPGAAPPWWNDADGAESQDADDPVATEGDGVIVVGNKASVASGRPMGTASPKSEQDLARAMIGMGRDPATGMPVGSVTPMRPCCR